MNSKKELKPAESSRSRAEKAERGGDEAPSLDLFAGLIKLHVLHHASEEPVYGLWLIEELAEHGYKVSPGTLYPLLHQLEKTGLLKSYSQLHDGKFRRYYKITSNGQRQLKKAKRIDFLQFSKILYEQAGDDKEAVREALQQVGLDPV